MKIYLSDCVMYKIKMMHGNLSRCKVHMCVCVTTKNIEVICQVRLVYCMSYVTWYVASWLHFIETKTQRYVEINMLHNNIINQLLYINITYYCELNMINFMDYRLRNPSYTVKYLTKIMYHFDCVLRRIKHYMTNNCICKRIALYIVC